MAETRPKKKKMSARNIGAGILMAILALSLLGFGVEGFGGGARTIGSVGDRNISTDEYARALQNELRALQSQIGQPVTMEQARMFGIDQRVLEQIVTGAVLDNEAESLGISAGDEVVQREIFEISAFRGAGGQFDREAYRFALQNAGMSETEFEESIRRDVARTILQLSVIGGASAPDALVEPLLSFEAQTRDFSVVTLDESTLPEPIGTPSEAELVAFHEAEIDRYTMPEGKALRYAWITPEMMVDVIDIDEQILRDAYEARRNEFMQPERRLVERLIFPDALSAEDAMARIEEGTAEFEDLVAERGLELEDTDMGDVSRAQLGAAGDAVFALDAPGVTGPVQTSLGPAIFRMNAVLSAQETTFEEAREQLRDEQLADLAQRALADDIDLYEDLLAGGATVEDLAQDTDMRAGTLDWRPDTREGIAAYQSFREIARQVQMDDFPEIHVLEDGGLFSVEMVDVLPAAPRPLDEIRDEVTRDWREAQILDALRARADEVAGMLRAGEAPGEAGRAPIRFEGITRNDMLPDLPRALVAEAFEARPDEIRQFEDGARLHLVQLHEINSPDLLLDTVQEARDSLRLQLEQSVAQDLFAYFTAALRDETSISLDQRVIEAVQSNF